MKAIDLVLLALFILACIFWVGVIARAVGRVLAERRAVRAAREAARRRNKWWDDLMEGDVLVWTTEGSNGRKHVVRVTHDGKFLGDRYPLFTYHADHFTLIQRSGPW